VHSGIRHTSASMKAPHYGSVSHLAADLVFVIEPEGQENCRFYQRWWCLEAKRP
jgi:hypothetical protein